LGVVVREAHAVLQSCDYDDLVIQYNPFSFGRWGFAPDILRLILSLRRRRPGVTIGLMVHEAHITFGHRPREAMMSAWQRLQLAMLGRMADACFVATGAWRKRLVSLGIRTRIIFLPVGSNLPDRRGARPSARNALGAREHSAVVVSLGGDHAGRLQEFIVAAVNAVADSGEHTVFVNLGGKPFRPEGLHPDVDVASPGYLESRQLADMISAADLFVAPFIDGISTRRCSVMAALQQGVAVLTTQSDQTDAILVRSPAALELAPVSGGTAAFAALARSLMCEPRRRAMLASAGRELYSERFAWPVHARTLIEGLSDVRVRN
jgi:glycosyltransferase involved in cell wall biosynthesis